MPSRRRRPPCGPHPGKPSGQGPLPPEADPSACRHLQHPTSQDQLPCLCLWAGSRLPPPTLQRSQASRALVLGLRGCRGESPYLVPQQAIDWTPALLLPFGDADTWNLNLLRPAALGAVGCRGRCPCRRPCGPQLSPLPCPSLPA